jgi:hypothetical protein
LVQERVGNTLEVIGIGKYFLNRTLAAQQLTEGIDKLDFIKLKRFCSTKEIVSKLKRPPTEWDKIFASYTSDKVTCVFCLYSDNQNTQGTQKIKLFQNQ